MPRLSGAIARAYDRMARVPLAYQRAFRTDDGARVLRDLAKEAGILAVVTVAGDPGLTHFNDGKRALFLHIVQKLRWRESDVMKLAEAMADEQAEHQEGLPQ